MQICKQVCRYMHGFPGVRFNSVARLNSLEMPPGVRAGGRNASWTIDLALPHSSNGRLYSLAYKLCCFYLFNNQPYILLDMVFECNSELSCRSLCSIIYFSILCIVFSDARGALQEFFHLATSALPLSFHLEVCVCSH